MNAFDFLSADDLSALLLITALKGAIILVGALLIMRLMTRTSAATRHVVWVLAFIAALVMPALLVAVPGWQVPVLPEGGVEIGLSEEVAFAMPGLTAEPGARDISNASLVSSRPMTKTLSLGALLLLFWGLGAFFVTTRWLAGVLSASALTRGAIILDDPEWTALVDRARASLGISRVVELRMSAHTRMPMTWGTFRPVVLLPESAIRWSVDRREVVLTHELAHVRRLDGVSQLVAQAACILHWFNPLVWMSYERFLIERERACDDYVLDVGTRASSYAEHLLEIARALHSRQRAELAMAPMAHRAQIEERLHSILDDQQRRDRLSRRLLAVVCVLVLALVWPVTAITFVARDHQSKTQDVPVPPDPPLAPMPPLPPSAPLPPLPLSAPLPPSALVLPSPPSPPPAAPAAPETYGVPSADLFGEPLPEAMSGPASSNVWTTVRTVVTDAQHNLKRNRDERFNARLDASLAAEIDDLHRSIQVDVHRIVQEVEDDRWDSLDERTRGVVQRIESVVRQARDSDESEWSGHPDGGLTSVNVDAVASTVALKRNASDESRPSAAPSRIRTNSDNCRDSGTQ